MFDFSFFELAVIGGVALIVIGPERLPRVARTVGQWVGKIQRYVSDVKNDINREMEFEELRRLRAEMNETARSVEATARSMENSLRQQAVPDAATGPAEPGQAMPDNAKAPELGAQAAPDLSSLPPVASTPDVASAEAAQAGTSAATAATAPETRSVSSSSTGAP